MTDKPPSETATPANNRDNQVAKVKCKNNTNRDQGNMAPSEQTSPTTASPGYSNKQEKQDLDLKSYLMLLIEDFKKDINNSLKELEENTNKQVKVLNKTIQDLKNTSRNN